jgi:hypothetical protein
MRGVVRVGADVAEVAFVAATEVAVAAAISSVFVVELVSVDVAEHRLVVGRVVGRAVDPAVFLESASDAVRIHVAYCTIEGKQVVYPAARNVGLAVALAGAVAAVAFELENFEFAIETFAFPLDTVAFALDSAD